MKGKGAIKVYGSRWSFDASIMPHTKPPMIKANRDLSELLPKHDQADLLCSIVEAVLQLVMEADVDGLIESG